MDALLSGSVDRTAIVWDPATGDVRQQFEFHSGAWTAPRNVGSAVWACWGLGSGRRAA